MRRWLYTLLMALALAPALWLLQRRGDAPAKARWRERLGAVPMPSQPIVLWLHAASVGEVQAATPLVDALLAQHGDGAIAVTTMTATGSALVRQRWGSRVQHAFAPLDWPPFVARFLRRWQPQTAVVMEAELWPHLFTQTKAQGIALLQANARMSPRSAQRLQRWGGRMMRETVAAIDCVAAQSQADAQAYRSMGAAAVHVVGNLKFECPLPAAQVQAGRAWRAMLGTQRPVWAAVSTHAQEEAAVLQAHRRLLEVLPDAALLLVPRHPQRFEAVAQTLQGSGLRLLRRSQSGLDAPAAQAQVLLGDSMGEMFSYLAAADVAFVGGSLQPIGGHNVLEPAALALPVLFGPHMVKQAPARDLLLGAGGAQQVADAPALAAALQALLQNPAQAQRMGQQAQAALGAHQGATAGILALLAALQKPAN